MTATAPRGAIEVDIIIAFLAAVFTHAILFILVAVHQAAVRGVVVVGRLAADRMICGTEW